MLLKAAKYENTRGEYESAEQRLLIAEKLRCDPSTDADERGLLTTRFHLCRSIFKQGRYKEAELMARSVADRSKALLGAQHSDTLAASHHLGDICNTMGNS